MFEKSMRTTTARSSYIHHFYWWWSAASTANSKAMYNSKYNTTLLSTYFRYDRSRIIISRILQRWARAQASFCCSSEWLMSKEVAKTPLKMSLGTFIIMNYKDLFCSSKKVQVIFEFRRLLIIQKEFSQNSPYYQVLLSHHISFKLLEAD